MADVNKVPTLADSEAQDPGRKFGIERELILISLEDTYGQLELRTNPLTSLSQARSQLREMNDIANRVLSDRGMRALAVGTHFTRYKYADLNLAHGKRRHSSTQVHVDAEDVSKETRQLVASWLDLDCAALVSIGQSYPYLPFKDLPAGGSRRRVQGLIADAKLPASKPIRHSNWFIDIEPTTPTIEFRSTDSIASTEDVAAIASMTRAMVSWSIRNIDSIRNKTVPPLHPPNDAADHRLSPTENRQIFNAWMNRYDDDLGNDRKFVKSRMDKIVRHGTESDAVQRVLEGSSGSDAEKDLATLRHTADITSRGSHPVKDSAPEVGF